MSDRGEKTCPLCAEEMDLTDQQLKPCKCGYEICVWCWHEIMDRAEKNETEGRCPACRTPYNKEKIVGTAANCERLVSEISVEKRSKPQRGKSKAEGRRHLANVRVIQRHLVYVIGMPLNLADEDLLQRREYFGQYGKVLKVSISRTAAGAIQQFPNSTCGVYITYSKEEEAVRCMQMVHGFVLDGRPLRACSGTTKYCHAWLRNMPCNNPDCLYLHEIGSQEDSFTKDEIVSGHTRDRLQQNTISFSGAQCRSGNILPAPADECGSIGSMSFGKPMSKTSVNANNAAIGTGVSLPNSSSCRSSALPAGASWGTRASSNQPLHASRPNSSEQPKQKSDTVDVPVTTSFNPVASLSPESVQHDTGEKLAPEDYITAPQSTTDEDTLNTQIPNKQSPYSAEIADTSLDSDKSVSETDSCDTTDESVNNLCSDISAMSINENQNLDNDYTEVTGESVFAQTTGEHGNITEIISGSSDAQCDMLSIAAQTTQVDLREIEDDLLSFERQRVNDPELSINRLSNISHVLHLSGHSNIHSSPFINTVNSFSDELYRKVDRNSDLVHPPTSFPNRNQENILNMNATEATDVAYFNLFPCKDKTSQLGSHESEMSFYGASNRGEDSIISNILSIDFDPWTSPHNLVKLFGEIDNQQVSSRAPGARRIHNSDQSRFLFAREEASLNHVSNFEQSVDYFGKTSKQQPFGYDFSSSNSLHIDKVYGHNDLSLINHSKAEIFASSHPQISSNKLSVSRSPISPPPGFSLRNRVPPPGFAYHERTEQLLDNFPGNRTLDNSSSRNEYHHTPSSANVINNNGDMEFIDPAILAVGKGMVPNGFNSYGLDISQNFTQQYNDNNTSEEAKFKSFLERSLPTQQNQRYSNIGDSYSPFGDSYPFPSRVMEQTLANSRSSFSNSRNGITSNGQWLGRSEVNGGKNLGMAELLRTERLGINKFYGGYEDSKIRMPGSGNLFNGTYGI